MIESMKFAIFVNLFAVFVGLNDECPQILFQLFADQTFVS